MDARVLDNDKNYVVASMNGILKFRYNIKDCYLKNNHTKKTCKEEKKILFIN